MGVNGMQPVPDVEATESDPLWFTVLMPVYNGEQYIREAIDSILAQTHPWFEFLIINDGSTDATAAILDDYAARDSRIRVIHQKNIDQPATLNRGLREARHDWVSIIDHDDISRPKRLERQAQMIRQNPEVRVVGTHGLEITSEGTVLGQIAFGPVTVREYRERRKRNDWMSFIHASVAMHRPTVLALGGYRPEFGSAADSDLWSRVADEHPVVAVNEFLVEYRVHLNSMSFNRFFEQQLKVRWIRACQDARRSGQPEPTLDELRASERGMLFTGRLNIQRYDWMMHFLRRRRLYRAEGKSVRAAGYFIAASLLDPLRASRSIARRLRQRNDASMADEARVAQVSSAPR